jgi:tetratricopeptide (TPR) repeat protein
MVDEVDIDLEYFKGVGVLLTDEIPIRKLKEIETQWLAEDYDNQHEWLHRGIFIYNKLLGHDPANDTYKYNLAKILFDNGIHMKRNQGTRRKAKRLFKEVIQINPHHPKAYLCHYQLGFLSLYERKWEKGICHFNQAIESGKLDYFQKLRAYCNLGICYSQNDEVEKANQCIEMARENDSKENRFTPEIEMANLQIQTAASQYKPFTLLTKDSAQSTNEAEAEEISTDYENHGSIVLDCRHHQSFLNGPKDSVKLSSTSADLLKILMTNHRSFSSGDLSEKLESESFGLKSIAEKSVKSLIKRLRGNLDTCFHEDEGKKMIQTTEADKKYQWNPDYPYKIIVPNTKVLP